MEPFEIRLASDDDDDDHGTTTRSRAKTNDTRDDDDDHAAAAHHRHSRHSPCDALTDNFRSRWFAVLLFVAALMHVGSAVTTPASCRAQRVLDFADCTYSPTTSPMVVAHSRNAYGNDETFITAYFFAYFLFSMLGNALGLSSLWHVLAYPFAALALRLQTLNLPYCDLSRGPPLPAFLARYTFEGRVNAVCTTSDWQPVDIPQRSITANNVTMNALPACPLAAWIGCEFKAKQESLALASAFYSLMYALSIPLMIVSTVFVIDAVLTRVTELRACGIHRTRAAQLVRDIYARVKGVVKTAHKLVDRALHRVSIWCDVLYQTKYVASSLLYTHSGARSAHLYHDDKILDALRTPAHRVARVLFPVRFLVGLVAGLCVVSALTWWITSLPTLIDLWPIAFTDTRQLLSSSTKLYVVPPSSSPSSPPIDSLFAVLRQVQKPAAFDVPNISYPFLITAYINLDTLNVVSVPTLLNTAGLLCLLCSLYAALIATIAFEYHVRVLIGRFMVSAEVAVVAAEAESNASRALALSFRSLGDEGGGGGGGGGGGVHEDDAGGAHAARERLGALPLSWASVSSFPALFFQFIIFSYVVVAVVATILTAIVLLGGLNALLLWASPIVGAAIAVRLMWMIMTAAFVKRNEARVVWCAPRVSDDLREFVWFTALDVLLASSSFVVGIVSSLSRAVLSSLAFLRIDVPAGPFDGTHEAFRAVVVLAVWRWYHRRQSRGGGGGGDDDRRRGLLVNA